MLNTDRNKVGVRLWLAIKLYYEYYEYFTTSIDLKKQFNFSFLAYGGLVVVARIMHVLVFSGRCHKNGGNFTDASICWWFQLSSNGQCRTSSLCWVSTRIATKAKCHNSFHVKFMLKIREHACASAWKFYNSTHLLIAAVLNCGEF